MDFAGFYEQIKQFKDKYRRRYSKNGYQHSQHQDPDFANCLNFAVELYEDIANETVSGYTVADARRFTTSLHDIDVTNAITI